MGLNIKKDFGLQNYPRKVVMLLLICNQLLAKYLSSQFSASALQINVDGQTALDVARFKYNNVRAIEVHTHFSFLWILQSSYM